MVKMIQYSVNFIFGDGTRGPQQSQRYYIVLENNESLGDFISGQYLDFLSQNLFYGKLPRYWNNFEVMESYPTNRKKGIYNSAFGD
jgi:hypothetical protein